MTPARHPLCCLASARKLWIGFNAATRRVRPDERLADTEAAFALTFPAAAAVLRGHL